jgi:hypothetical protein
MTALKNILLSGRKNNIVQTVRMRLRNEPYLTINIIFAGVILLIFAYSGIFSPEKNNYPVACIHEKLTGLPCVSCGLSHSFSLIIRGRFSEAYSWNHYGMKIFSFFALQLVLRIIFSIFYLNMNDPEKRKQFIVGDSIGSGMIFLAAFWPFITNILSTIHL